jgi:dTDP-L-rhamnose 4-epimerase
MHVLVTGGAGFIGAHLVDALLARGDSVTVLDALVERVHPDRRPPPYLNSAATLIQGDVSVRQDWLPALEGADAVLHFAAYQDYQPDFGRFALVNDVGTALLYEVVVAHELPVKKIVVASSQAVYGEGAYRCARHGLQHPPARTLRQLGRADWEVRCPVCADPVEPVASREAHPNPHNAYAVSKIAQENYALVLGRRNAIPSAALRFSIIQGPRQSPANAYSGALRAFTSRLTQDQPPVVFEDGRQLRDYTHVDDAVAATLLVLDDARADFEVFNVGGGETMSVLDFARAVARALGRDIEPDVSGRYRVDDARHVWSDTSKLQALGWRPTTSIERIISDYLDQVQASSQDVDWVGRALDDMERAGTLRRVE